MNIIRNTKIDANTAIEANKIILGNWIFRKGT